MKIVVCEQCGKELPLDVEGQIENSPSCSAMECPLDLEYLESPDELLPLQFHQEFPREYEPDFFDGVDDEEDTSDDDS